MRPKTRKWPFVQFLAVVWCLVLTAAAAAPEVQSHSENTLTFSKDIAPILFSRCAICHRPGQSGPFSLLNYADTAKHAKEIGEVIAKRIMPPWPPEPGFGEFSDVRALTTNEIALIQRWISGGLVEGLAKDLPPLPAWNDGWQLGEPDLVVQMSVPYTLPAEGKDIYRNFVVPVPITTPRFVKAVEFRPGNPKIVHHAFVRVDRTRQSRRLEGKDGQPGFAGMALPDSVQTPSGHFLAWQPGKIASVENESLSWRLETNTDLVLQLHMRPTGKAEPIQASVGLYFTGRTPTNTPFKLALTSLTIDIPPGKSDYIIEDTFVLPVDVEALAVLPHAHYLCKEMQGYASLPDGSKKWLLLIKNWNFQWQGDYRFAQPVPLPKDSVLTMRYLYDNSTNNPENPHQPPQRVAYGPNAGDEMAELWIQVLAHNSTDFAALAKASSLKTVKVFTEYKEHLLELNPGDAKAHTDLAQALLAAGKNGEGIAHLRKAVEIQPDNEEAHYFLGMILRSQNRVSDAQHEFEETVRINPENYKAHVSLGMTLLQQGQVSPAEEHLKKALEINPDDGVARQSMGLLLKVKAQMAQRPQ